VKRLALLLLLLTPIAGCGAPETDEALPADAAVADDAECNVGEKIPSATSLLGEPLYPVEPTPEFRAEQQQLLEQALNELRADPTNAEARIWAGRRNAYLGRYETAITLYTKSLEMHPEDARFLRHRGHRYISTRKLDLAIEDLTRAAELRQGKEDEVEPDGLPNDRNIPTSTLHSNIWYHLGLAHYLQGDFEAALEAYRECVRFSVNPDMLSATSHWLYMTLRRLGRDEEAAAVLEPIEAGMDIIENDDYHRLLMMYKGQGEPDELLAAAEEGTGFATTAYGVGNWHLYNGEEEQAFEIFERILATDSWAAFGHIAAEAELAGR
jgi:tetratricopeptide (TPR) repeat protein